MNKVHEQIRQLLVINNEVNVKFTKVSGEEVTRNITQIIDDTFNTRNTIVAESDNGKKFSFYLDNVVEVW